MWEKAKGVAIVLLAIALLPIMCLLALFCDEDPENDYRMRNW